MILLGRPVSQALQWKPELDYQAMTQSRSVEEKSANEWSVREILVLTGDEFVGAVDGCEAGGAGVRG